MSKYTTEVRFICEEYAGEAKSQGYADIDKVLEKAIPKVFDFDFPIFDEDYRLPLENKILRHYYMREIGFETTALWKFHLANRLNEIMPYYNKLYESELIKFNPLYNTDLTTDYQKVDNGTNEKTGDFSEQNASNEKNTHVAQTTNDENVVSEEITHGTEEGANVANSKTSSTTNSDTTSGTNTSEDRTLKNDHWEYFSDTPEGQLDGIEENKYLTTVLHTTDDGTGSTVETESSTETETSTTNISDTDTTGLNNAEYNGTKNNETTTTGISNTNEETNKEGTNDKYGTNNSQEKIQNVEDYLHHVVGKRGEASYSKLLEEYRATFLNIDMSIIADLNDLFFMLW